MLKCILLLISEYYYETVSERIEELAGKIHSHQTTVLLKRTTDAGDDKTFDFIGNEEGLLVITDEPAMAQKLLDHKCKVVILYHEQNREQSFPSVRYGIEDLFQVEYKSYEEAYRRLAGLPWEILQTEKLLVRESILADVDEFYRIYKEPSITRYMENLYEDRDAERAYMKEYIDRIYGFYGYGLWTVILKETGQIIGRAGLSVREGYEFPELGFLIDAAYQRKGYGYEVCRAILRYAKEELEFEKVQALVDEKNTISLHLLEKLGFVLKKMVQESGHDYKFLVKIL